MVGRHLKRGSPVYIFLIQKDSHFPAQNEISLLNYNFFLVITFYMLKLKLIN